MIGLLLTVDVARSHICLMAIQPRTINLHLKLPTELSIRWLDLESFCAVTDLAEQVTCLKQSTLSVPLLKFVFLSTETANCWSTTCFRLQVSKLYLVTPAENLFAKLNEHLKGPRLHACTSVRRSTFRQICSLEVSRAMKLKICSTTVRLSGSFMSASQRQKPPCNCACLPGSCVRWSQEWKKVDVHTF